MFEHLRDPDPPEPQPGTRAAVAERARHLRRRGQVARAGIALVVVVLVVGAGLATGRRGTPDATTVEIADGGRTCCGTIEGIVRDSAGPLKGITVSLMPVGTEAPRPEDPSPWKVQARALTDGAGHVAFTGLEAGRYAIRAEDHPDPLLQKVRHQPAFYAGAPILSRATALTVEPDRTVAFDLALELSPTATITGDVRESAQHFPIAGITVKLFSDNELTRETTTDANGSYDLGGVEAGVYTLEFFDNKGLERAGGVAFRAIWYAGPDRPEGNFTSVPLTVGTADITADITLVR